jgi:hypothetical protein
MVEGLSKNIPSENFQYFITTVIPFNGAVHFYLDEVNCRIRPRPLGSLLKAQGCILLVTHDGRIIKIFPKRTPYLEMIEFSKQYFSKQTKLHNDNSK